MKNRQLFSEHITQEGISDMYDTMVKDLKKLKSNFINLLTTTNSSSKDLEQIKAFKNIAKVKIAVPEGFKGNLADYCAILKEKDKYLTQDINKYIRKIEILVANIINSKGRLFDKIGAQKLLDEMFLYTDSYNRDVIEAFNINYQDNLTLVKVGDVLSSIGEVHEVINYASNPSTLTTKDIIKEVTAITDQMNELALLVKEAVSLLHSEGNVDTEHYQLLSGLIDELNDMVTQISRAIHHRSIIIKSTNNLILALKTKG